MAKSLKGSASRRDVLSGTVLGGAALIAFVANPSRGHANPGSGNPNQRSDEEFLPFGRQLEISGYNQRLIVTEVGAGMRSYQVNGQEFLRTFPETATFPPGSTGMLLCPWPGRLINGAYTFDGVAQQVPVTSPNAPTTHANHGFVRTMNWQVVHHDEHRLAMDLVLHIQPGYPFVLHLLQEYELTWTGLKVTTTARNRGTTSAPYAFGMHPYFTVGTPTIDSAILRVPAGQFMPQNGVVPVPPAVSIEGTPQDFREARAIGATNWLLGGGFIYTDFIRDPDGMARVWMAPPAGGPMITIWMDEAFSWLTMIQGTSRATLAVEMQTSCANSYNNGLGLQVLPPGGSFQSTWGAEVTG